MTSSMTLQDYESIAGAVARSRMAKGIERNALKRAAALDGIQLVATDLASTLAARDPRFDRARFLQACGF